LIYDSKPWGNICVSFPSTSVLSRKTTPSLASYVTQVISYLPYYNGYMGSLHGTKWQCTFAKHALNNTAIYMWSKHCWGQKVVYKYVNYFECKYYIPKKDISII
jgi:hypothetical protein